MSGLIAFTGPPDPQRLHRMAMRLSHRGCLATRPDRVLQTAHGSIGVLEWDDWCPPGRVQSGIHTEGSEAVALSGFAFDRVPSTLTAESLSNFRGSFTVASIVDGELRIARDAHGCQSLFYGRCGARWLVATEPKAITGEAEFVSRIRVAGIAEYLSFSFTPTHQTMLEDVSQATAGALIGLRDGHAPTIRRYFNAADAEVSRHAAHPDQDDDYWIRRTRTTIEQAVAERMPRETPLVFLSGGLDSSIVAAEVAKQRDEPIRTFSIHFGHRYPNELPFAAMVARRIGSEHEEVLIEPKQFLPKFETMIRHLDEPIGDPITQPKHRVNIK